MPHITDNFFGINVRDEISIAAVENGKISPPAENNLPPVWIAPPPHFNLIVTASG